MNLPLELALSLLAADFVSGLVHWAEDTFGTESTPVLGAWIVAPNVLHHRDPGAFTSKGWWASSWDLALVSALIVAVACALDALTPGVALFAIAGANANAIHKACHAPARAPILVRALWRTGLLQTPRQHARHHSGAKDSAYCVLTPFLNPVLDRLGFWRALERVTVPIFGAPRRTDLVPTAPPLPRPAAEAGASAARRPSPRRAPAATRATPPGCRPAPR